MITKIKADSPQDALKQVRKVRLAHKDQWLFLVIDLDEKTFHAKVFNLAIQRLQCDGVFHSDGWDLTTKQFDEKLLAAFSYK